MLVITGCSNRKRKPVAAPLHASSLPPADTPTLAYEWGRRLARSESRFPAFDIYGGRAFQEALTSARSLDARFLVVSAGLGLIDAASEVPPYACTVLVGAEDSLPDRSTESFSVQTWWSALRGASPYARPLASFVAENDGPILAALSDTYLAMIEDEIAALPAADLARLRLFTRAPAAKIAPKLRPHVMPYDDRLDGPDSPLRGARSDFASRALRHFVQMGSRGSVEIDTSAVEAALSGWRMPAKIERDRKDNGELLALIRRHWDTVGGRSSRLLRLFRDDLGIACEQGRFAALARQVREERT